MKRALPLLLLTFATTAALAGVLYLLAQLQVLSFIPLDIAEAINHVTPGQIATEGIELIADENRDGHWTSPLLKSL